METSDKQFYSCGTRKKDDFDCEFDINEGDKVIGFSGVYEVMFNECRFLNMALTTKNIWEDCEGAENSPYFREIIHSKYETFNAMKTDFWD